MLASIFPAITLTHGQHVDLDWPEFVARYLSRHEVRHRKDGRLFSFAAYKGDPHRNDTNVRAMSGIVIDIDNKVGTGNDEHCSATPTIPEHHFDNLGDITYAWYSTHQNTSDWPRWRLMFPLDREVLPHEWPAVFDGAMAMLGRDENIDPSCKDLSRAYYTPSCSPACEASAFAGFHAGRHCTVDELLSMTAVVIGDNVHSLPGVDQRHPGRNNRLKAVAAAMLGRVAPVESIVLELLKVDTEHNPPLFTDRSEGYGGSAEAGALKFLGNIALSHSARSKQQGGAPDALYLRGLGQSHAAPDASLPPIPPDAPYKLKPATNSFLELRPIRWVIEGFVAAGEVVTFAGQPGVGKSTAFAALSLVVSGFGQQIGSNLANDRRRQVCIVSEHPEQYQRLLYGFIARYGLDGAEVERWVHMYDTARLNMREVGRELRHLVDVHSGDEPPLILLDTASATFNLANENDNAEVGGLLAAIKAPVTDTGAPLWIVAHAAKALGREDSDISPRGASAFMGDVHGTASVFREKDRPDSIFIRSLKNRNQREFDEIELSTEVQWHEVVDERGVVQRQGIRLAAPMSATQTQAQRSAETRQATAGVRLQAAKAYVVDYLEARPGECITARTFYPPEERGRHARDMVRDGIAELLRDGVLGREIIDPPPRSGARERLVLVDAEWGKGLWR